MICPCGKRELKPTGFTATPIKVEENVIQYSVEMLYCENCKRQYKLITILKEENQGENE